MASLQHDAAVRVPRLPMGGMWRRSLARSLAAGLW